MNQLLDLNVLTDIAGIRGIVPQWQALWSRCPHATIFQRPQWLLPWIEVFQPSAPLMIVIRKGGQLVGIAALLIYLRDTSRVLAFMGGGVSDYLEALIDPQYEGEVLAALWNYIQRESAAWDVVDLTDLPATSALLRDNSGFEVHPHDVCPTLLLPTPEEGLRSVVPFRKMANLRNARNRISRAGKSRIEVASSETLLPILEVMFCLHAARWARVAQSGVLADESIQEFHRRAALPLWREGVLRLYTLFLNDQVIAALHTFFEQDAVRLYLHAFDPEFACLSPGTLIFGAVIEDAFCMGKRSVDFLRGDEPYKYAWGARNVPTFSVSMTKAAGSAAKVA